MPAPPRLLVTGAAGFVGRAACRRFAALGRAPRAAVRAVPDRPVEGARETVAVGDLADWSAALRDVDAVIHLAARAHVRDTDAEFRRVNVDGTLRLARAARDAGVRRLVYVGSAGVLGNSSPGRPFTADDPPRPHDAYTRSKAEAESALRAEGGPLEICIVRPPLLYGPGVPANFLALMRAVDAERVLPFGAVENRRDLLGVDNLADALLAAADHPLAAGKTYLAADGEPVSTPGLIRRLAEALGRRPRLWRVPVALLRAGAFLAGRSRTLEKLVGSFEVDASPLRRELGWSPRVPLRDGLLAAARAYRV